MKGPHNYLNTNGQSIYHTCALLRQAAVMSVCWFVVGISCVSSGFSAALKRCKTFTTPERELFQQRLQCMRVPAWLSPLAAGDAAPRHA